MWTFVAVASAFAVSVALVFLPTPETWWHLFKWTYYPPIVLLSVRHGPLAGLFAGLAASLLWAVVTALRGVGEMAWHSTLSPDFAVVGLLGGGFIEVWQRSRRRHRDIGDNGWVTLGSASGQAINLDLNPLASIQSAAGLLAEGDTPAELRQELFGIISTECSRLSASITGLMERTPAAPFLVCEADIGAIADAALREAEFVLCGQGVIVSRDIATDLPPIQCNPDQIRNLVMSLTMNVMQSASTGKDVVLTVRAQNEGVSLDIRDRAKGSFLNRAGKYLFSSRPVITGGGFAAAYEIVRQHSGKIEARLNARKGLEFSVWLPPRRNRADGSGQSTGGGGR